MDSSCRAKFFPQIVRMAKKKKWNPKKSAALKKKLKSNITTLGLFPTPSKSISCELPP
jgi:hypothetical protein